MGIKGNIIPKVKVIRGVIRTFVPKLNIVEINNLGLISR